MSLSKARIFQYETVGRIENTSLLHCCFQPDIPYHVHDNPIQWCLPALWFICDISRKGEEFERNCAMWKPAARVQRLARRNCKSLTDGRYDCTRVLDRFRFAAKQLKSHGGI